MPDTYPPGHGTILTPLTHTDDAVEQARQCVESKPGTPAHRFTRIMEELEKRFPDAAPALLSDPPEPKYLAAIDALKAELKQAWTQVEVLKQPLVRTGNTEVILNLERENERLRGLLDECMPPLKDLIARLYKEGCPLANSDARWIERLLERMEG